MKTALLVADLEGIVGVDALEALAFGGLGHRGACAAMLREVNHCAEALAARGYQTVRVSDSHRSGSGESNLERAELHPSIELVYTDPDYYGGALLDGVSAVACVGMHAAARTHGFAAHTVQIHCSWSLGGREVSESDLALWLAAERKIPFLFTAGDDVLCASFSRSAPAVLTKRSTAPDTTKSLGWPDVAQALTAAAGAAPIRASAPSEPIVLRFKTHAQAELAAGTKGLKRTSALTFEARKGTFTARYHASIEACEAAAAALSDEVHSFPGTRAFAADAQRLLLAPFDP